MENKPFNPLSWMLESPPNSSPAPLLLLRPGQDRGQDRRELADTGAQTLRTFLGGCAWRDLCSESPLGLLRTARRVSDGGSAAETFSLHLSDAIESPSWEQQGPN